MLQLFTKRIPINNMEEKSQVAIFNEEIKRELSDPNVGKALLATTFKGLTDVTMKQAMLEWMIRGGKFKEFLQKDVYAIPYGNGYSLVTSIDYSRKIGAKSGIVGVAAPVYNDDTNTCSVTVKKRFEDGYIGDFTAEVYFSEYSTGKNLWASKPRTMIAKVAEMHALRKACPEELSQSYVEEEIQREVREVPVVDLTLHENTLRACTSEKALEVVWADMPGDAKAKLKPVLEEMKKLMRDE